jgi:hypothetical protein
MALSYRAEIRRDGKRIAKTHQQYATKEQVDAFIAEHWPQQVPFKYENIDKWETPLELKVWRRMAQQSQIIVHARTSVQRHEPDPLRAAAEARHG